MFPFCRPASSFFGCFAGCGYPDSGRRRRRLLAASALDECCGSSPAMGATSSDEVAHRRAGWRRLAAPAAHILRVSYWPPLPLSASRCSLRPTGGRSGQPPPPAGSDTRRCSCLRAGRLTLIRWIFYWQSLPLFGLAPIPPSGFAAGRRGRRSLRIAVFAVFDCRTSGSKSRAGGATPCAGRNPSLRSVASALAPHTLRVSYWQPLPHRLRAEKKYLRPYGSRARRRPLAEGATRPARGFSAGVKRWVKAANKRRCASPLQREGCDPKTSSEAVARGNFISLCSRKVERNSSLCGRATAVPLGTRNGQPLPRQAYTLQVSILKRKPPSGRAGPACPRRAMGSLYPEQMRRAKLRFVNSEASTNNTPPRIKTAPKSPPPHPYRYGSPPVPPATPASA